MAVPARTYPKSVASFVENALVVPAAIIIAAAVSYWAMYADRTPPFELSEGEIIPQSVRGGEPITARWRVTQLREASYSQTCTREVIDSLGTFRRVDEQERASVLPPKENYIARSVNIPFDVSWGRAYYRQSCCYKIDGISLTKLFPICIRRPELPFEVLPSPKK